MELKFVGKHTRTHVTRGSNRTFMELKLRLEDGSLHSSSRSNRTFMELKYATENIKIIDDLKVLIVPLWN